MKITVTITDNVLQFQQMPETFKDGIYEVEITNIDLRSQAQNRSLWLWMAQIANILNRNNVPVEQVIKADIVWSKDLIKELFWDRVMLSMFGKKTSTKLTKEEIDPIVHTLSSAFGSRGVTLPPFPSIETKEQENKK